MGWKLNEYEDKKCYGKYQFCNSENGVNTRIREMRNNFDQCGHYFQENNKIVIRFTSYNLIKPFEDVTIDNIEIIAEPSYQTWCVPTSSTYPPFIHSTIKIAPKVYPISSSSRPRWMDWQRDVRSSSLLQLPATYGLYDDAVPGWCVPFNNSSSSGWTHTHTHTYIDMWWMYIFFEINSLD